MNDRLPRTIPLPQVPEYTDDIIFGNLGLPVGFDYERILVNVRGINRIRSVAGLGVVSVIGEQGDTSTYDYGVTSVDQSGAATMSGSKKVHKEPTSEGSVRFSSGNPFFGKADTTITINTSEIRDRIRTKEGAGSLYEPSAVAKQLNKAVRHGLVGASVDANLDSRKALLSLRAYGLVNGFCLIAGAAPERGALLSLIGMPVFYNIAMFQEAVLMDILEKSSESPLQVWKKLRQGLIVPFTVDRTVAASGLAKTTRFIKSR